MRLSAPDLELLRQRPSQTALSLFIFQPRSVMKCLVNNVSIAKGARTIAYDTVSSGSYLAVEDGMTLLIGTSAGASDIGRIRIRSVTSGAFTVSENSNIVWADNLHLTVLRYWEIWPVFPQNVQSGTNVTFYKDYDIAYTNQNSILGTFVNAGPHRPVVLENGTGTTYYSSTGTYNLLGEALTYDWAFEGGTPTGSTSATPGNVNYTTVGDYVTRLKVTSASGTVDTTYRYVSVKNKIGEGSTTPIAKWTMSDLSGSRAEAGYSAEFTVYDNIIIDNNAVVMLLADDWYGGTKRSLGGNYLNTEKIFFVGYIDGGSIRYNYQYSHFSFRVSSITQLMKRATGFSISVESKKSPTTWFELLDLDCRRAIYHYLRWQSTVLKVVDFNFVGQDYKLQYFDADRTSIFDAIDNLMRGTLFGDISADRQGRLWAEVHPMAYSNPTGTFTPVMEITNRDWMGQPEIGERYSDEVSTIELGGVAYSGTSTGTFSALLAEAPGGVPAFRGTIEKSSGLALLGQSQLNTMVGNVFANKNSRYPSISLEMAIPPRNLDIAPQEVIRVLVSPSDTIRGVNLDKLFIPESFSWKYDSTNQILLSSMEAINLVNGQVGDTIIIPDTPSEELVVGGGSFGGGFSVPGIKIPTLPSLNPFASKTYTWVIKSPSAGGVPGPKLAMGAIAVAVSAYAVGGTSVTFNIETRSTIGSAGTDIMGSDLVATTSGAVSASGASLPAGNWLWLDIASVSGVVTNFVVTVSVFG